MTPGKRVNLGLVIILSLYAFLLVAQKIVLVTADLGRHLVNGRLFINQGLITKTNYYSYTHPDFPVINHHWGSGVVFYLLSKLVSFPGLSIFYGLLIALSFGLMLDLGAKLAKNRYIIALIGLLVLPLVTYRVEVRPEGLSFLFFSLDFYLLWQMRRWQKKWQLILIYLFSQILWVNLHIFFVFGLILPVFSLIDAWLSGRRQLQKPLLILVIGAFLVNLANPFGLQGLLEPFIIFKNYGYMIVENQSLVFGLKRLFSLVFVQTLSLIILSLAGLVYMLVKSRRQIDWLVVLTWLLSLGLAANYIRAIPLFGLSLVVFLTLVFNAWTSASQFRLRLVKISLFSLIAFIVSLGIGLPTPYSPFKLHRFGFGLSHQVEASAKFFLDNKLAGPIFNNYDIGGYLIYYLYPKEKVFIDNRPEAYPASFFQDVYIPAQEDENAWQQLDKKYNFNLIFFYRHDATPWAQPFLVRRLKDTDWVPIYVDGYTLILIKNKPQNRKLIDKYRLPDKMFIIS